MSVPQMHTRHHTYSTSRDWLNLDCSADLNSYRRDLGPGVQAKCFEKTSDTIRAQLDDHRAFLLQHRQNGSASGFPSPIPRLEIPQSWTMSGQNIPSSQMTALNYNYHVASHPRPLQFLSQPHKPLLAPASRSQEPVPGNVATWPSDLRRALEQGAQYGHRYATDTVYEVTVEVISNCMRDSKEAVGTYESLQTANMEVAKAFLFDGPYESGLGVPTYEVKDDGVLKIKVVTDSSRGGDTTISVEAVPLRRPLGQKR